MSDHSLGELAPKGSDLAILLAFNALNSTITALRADLQTDIAGLHSDVRTLSSDLAVQARRIDKLVLDATAREVLVSADKKAAGERFSRRDKILAGVAWVLSFGAVAFIEPLVSHALTH